MKLYAHLFAKTPVAKPELVDDIATTREQANPENKQLDKASNQKPRADQRRASKQRKKQASKRRTQSENAATKAVTKSAAAQKETEAVTDSRCLELPRCERVGQDLVAVENCAISREDLDPEIIRALPPTVVPQAQMDSPTQPEHGSDAMTEIESLQMQVSEMVAHQTYMQAQIDLQRSAMEAQTECILCMHLERDSVLFPCMHVGYCRSCASALETCPQCRVVITQVARVYSP